MKRVAIGSHPDGKGEYARAGEILKKRLAGHAYRWHQPARDEDTFLPGLMVAMGVLSALACVGFWPGQRLAIFGVSLAVGLVLIPAAAITLPPLCPVDVWLAGIGDAKSKLGLLQRQLSGCR